MENQVEKSIGIHYATERASNVMNIGKLTRHSFHPIFVLQQFFFCAHNLIANHTEEINN
jgi:hypothetical protein